MSSLNFDVNIVTAWASQTPNPLHSSTQLQPFPKALQFNIFVFTILVYVFIWFANLRGFALNFRAWEWGWACGCGGCGLQHRFGSGMA
jgi:hypothetical protein